MTQNFEKIIENNPELTLSDLLGAVASGLRELPVTDFLQVARLADCMLILEDLAVELEVKASRLDEIEAAAKAAVDQNENVVAFKPSERIAQMHVFSNGPDDGRAA